MSDHVDLRRSHDVFEVSPQTCLQMDVHTAWTVLQAQRVRGKQEVHGTTLHHCDAQRQAAKSIRISSPRPRILASALMQASGTHEAQTLAARSNQAHGRLKATPMQQLMRQSDPASLRFTLSRGLDLL